MEDAAPRHERLTAAGAKRSFGCVEAVKIQ